MNIMNRLTFRQLLKNKRRTIVTIIGVIISVAMITAVTSLGDSFMDLLRREHIKNQGEWHVKYRSVNAEQLAALEAKTDAKALVVMNDAGYARLDGSENPNRPYLFLSAYSAEAFEHFPVELTSGRYPGAAGEVIISDEINLTAGTRLKLGDHLNLDVGQRYVNNAADPGVVLDQNMPLRQEEDGWSESIIDSRTTDLIVVGTMARPRWEPTWAPAYTIVSFLDPASLNEDATADVAVILNKVRRSIFNDSMTLADELGIENIDFNSELLRFHGVSMNDNLNQTLFRLTAIILTVTVLASMALIYNAFAISVAERSRYLGMLSSVGATRKQKRDSVFFEGFLIALVSIPLGLLSGFAGLGLTFRIINSTIQGAFGLSEALLLRVRATSVIVAVLLSALTIFISTWNPARKASKVSAIDAIRQSDDIRLSGKSLRTSPLIRHLFGLEAEIGLKNLKRNRRRYLATVLSIVMSLLLFLSVSYFTIGLNKALNLSQDGVDFDIQIISELEQDATRQMASSLGQRDEVIDLNLLQETNTAVHLPTDLLALELQDIAKNDPTVLVNGFYHYYANIYALDKSSMAAYATQIGLDIDTFMQEDRRAAIMIETAKYERASEGMIIETRASQLRLGDRIDLKSFIYEEDEEAKDLASLEIVALTDTLPMGIRQPGLGDLTIIVSEDSFEALSRHHDAAKSHTIYLRSEDPMQTQYALEEQTNSSLQIYNVFQSRQQEQQMILLMSVFTYGFIVLMTAICIANIFNTISTGVALRKREFAMLKSIGMTPQAFNRMIRFESLFYGIKALAIGLPFSILVMYLIHQSLVRTLRFDFELPWMNILFAIGAVFIIVGSAMLYSSAKIKHENIIDAIKQENI